MEVNYFTGKGNGTPLQYFSLENPMDGGAGWPAVHGVVKSRIRLSNFTFTFHFHALEKEMATHSSVLAWRIPGTEKPGGLLSMGSHRVGHDWSDLAAAAAITLQYCIGFCHTSTWIRHRYTHVPPSWIPLPFARFWTPHNEAASFSQHHLDEFYSFTLLYSSYCMTTWYFIHSTVERHLGLFQVWTVIYKAIMNILVWVCWST